MKRNEILELIEAAKLGLSFAPNRKVPKGTDPTFYFTLNYEDECVLQKRINKARRLIKRLEKQEK